MLSFLFKIIKRHLTDKFDESLVIIFVTLIVIFGFYHFSLINNLSSQVTTLLSSGSTAQKQLLSIKQELTDLKNQDQVKINKDLQTEIKNIETNYDLAVSAYEKLVDLKPKIKDSSKLDSLFAQALKQLSQKNFASASSTLADLNTKIQQENDKLVSSFTIPANVLTSNTPPKSGFSSQTVQTDSGSFLVNIVSADLNSTKVIVDTASDSDCSNNCPVLSLADYVNRNGAFAGINGSFFCPAEYPSCAGKTNSFDTLLMNKNKHYFNSDNNVYSVVPAVIFQGSSIRFVGQSLQWGRDTSIDSMIANYPLYVVGSQNQFGGNGDPKIDNKGTRTFVANIDSTVYIGVIYNASGSDAAKVLKTLGMHNALGLDQGGSTALWYGGYKAGPGRNIPNAVLFVKR
ncbi:phosphodiester glycosidase family protein [Candidatus Daviesbacteria bacterium]|nr:phosphodiester glycosidase family protein [Candidatus Daviesbacteria bacterium]